MTAAEFKKKWSRYQGKESAAYQEHFNDLCGLLGQTTPAEADPSGSDFFCFQKRVVKDLELFDTHATPDVAEPNERGFADVWKKGCFAWEYKGRKKNLDEAYKQLLRYRESLLNPPLLVVCDFDRYIVRTNFNGTVQEVHEFTNAEIDRPEHLRTLRALFENPDFLKPQRTTAQVTENLAETIAEVARSLQKREAEELADARSRKEMNFAQRKNLRIARFLNRIVFCFFAEDTGLLPKNLFSDLLKTGIDDPKHFAGTLENLFSVMAKGGTFGKDKIRHFNGHLFEESTVFEFTEVELKTLADAGQADWQFIQPSIMGTLFERALEPEQRSQLGAHYTSEADIKTLVEPVLMAPLRREWAALKGELTAAYAKGKGTPAQRDKLATFQKKLTALSVLDPACGSGNFLYVSLQLLLDLEKGVITFATQLGFKLAPQVSVQQLRAIEINPYAFELAQVSAQIGYLQWRRDNGFDNDRSPVLQNLDSFQNEDALLVPHFHSKAKTLKEAQAGEHWSDDALKFYTEREWPNCDVIISNPPFLHSSKLLRELGQVYRAGLFKTFKNRVSGFADLCCYWFEKARKQIADGKAKRAGLLATQSIRGGVSRDVLNRIKETGNIFFAISDRDWVLAGANVHISMVGFDDGSEPSQLLDGVSVIDINANLTAHADTTKAKILKSNADLCFYGSQQKAPFDIGEQLALEMLHAPNPHGLPNSDVVRPSLNASQFVRRGESTWVIDFGLRKSFQEAASYEAPINFVRKNVLPLRTGHRELMQAKFWWLHARPSPRYREVAKGEAVLITPAVAKHRIFGRFHGVVLADHALIAYARADDYFFGALQSCFHEVWTRAQGTQVRERESGFRYTPTTCFETFPFPFADDLWQLPLPPAKPLPKLKPSTYDQIYAENLAAKNYFMGKEEPPAYGRPGMAPEGHRAAVASAVKELSELRDRWLNPPEWTQTRTLEFPGSANGPWMRYIDPNTVDAKIGIGTVRYPRLEPRDADCAAKLKKRTLTNLYNERPAWLDLAHKKLDATVAVAYGWPIDLSDEQILEKLLALNLERAAEEEKVAGVKREKPQRTKHHDELV
jgi:type II restriction/modification system DNA methylase subunit YeeA